MTPAPSTPPPAARRPGSPPWAPFALLALLLLGGLACGEKVTDHTEEVPQASRIRHYVAGLDGRVDLEWTENRDLTFAAYELRRSDTPPVTRGSTLVLRTSDRACLRHVDATPKLAKTYYYRVYVVNERGAATGGNDVVVNIPEPTDPGIYGFIGENDTWDLSTSPVVVKGDLTILQGVTLTIMPGVEVRFLSRDCLASGRYTDRPELIVRGTLRVAGENGRPVRLVSGSLFPERGGWGGVWFDHSTGGTNNRIERAVIRHAATALRLDASELGLYNARLEMASEAGIDLQDARLSAANCIVHAVGAGSGFGVRCGSASTLHLTNCLIGQIAGVGLHLDGAGGSVRNLLIGYCDGAGIAASDLHLPTLRNTIVLECGVGLRALADGGAAVSADYNDYWRTVTEGYTPYLGVAAGAHDRRLLPEFAAPDWNAPQRGDFTLKSGSPLSRAGEAGAPMGLANPLSLGVIPE